MTAVLTPALAVQYLAELEPALEVAIVGPDGKPVAGDPSLAEPLPAGSKTLLTARGARHTVIARVPPGALENLVSHDLEAVARELG